MMDRREFFALPLAVAGTAAVKVSHAVILDSSKVGADLQVYGDKDGDRFSLTLFDKPWPTVGQRIVFTCKWFSLVGVVTSYEVEPHGGADRVWYHIQGTVESFDGLSLVEHP